MLILGTPLEDVCKTVKSLKHTEIKMFRSRSRCFVNRYKDFSGSLGSVEYLRDLVGRVLQLIEEKSPPERSSHDGGLYVGGAGIGYAFYAVAESSAFANIREQCLKKALEYMQVILIYYNTGRTFYIKNNISSTNVTAAV